MRDGSQAEFGLLPERANEFRPALHRLQASAREVADLRQTCRTQVGDFVLLQVGPDRLDRIELGSVRRQEGNRDLAVLLFEPLAHPPAFVRADAVPNDQQLAPDLALERAKELDDLFAVDRAVDEAEVEAPPRQAGNRRHLLPGKALLDDGGAPAQAPSASHGALLGEPRLVDEDYGSPFAFGVFLAPAKSCASRSRSPARRAAAPAS